MFKIVTPEYFIENRFKTPANSAFELGEALCKYMDFCKYYAEYRKVSDFYWLGNSRIDMITAFNIKFNGEKINIRKPTDDEIKYSDNIVYISLKYGKVYLEVKSLHQKEFLCKVVTFYDMENYFNTKVVNVRIDDGELYNQILMAI